MLPHHLRLSLNPEQNLRPGNDVFTVGMQATPGVVKLSGVFAVAGPSARRAWQIAASGSFFAGFEPAS
jgi:hypothetical protein